MKKIPISLICGVLLILVTILLYYIIFGNTLFMGIRLLTLIGLVIAEAVTTLLAFFSKGEPRKVAAAFVSSVMIPVALTLSIVYSLVFPLGYATYIAWYFVCYLLTASVVIILWVFQAKRAAQNADFQNAKGQMLRMRKIVTCIMADPAAAPYKKQLREIEEKLHFTNDGVVAAQDTEICSMLLDLQDNVSNAEYDVPAQIEKLKKLIDVRTVMTSTTL